jgi:SAM-dependent methyltransferase
MLFARRQGYNQSDMRRRRILEALPRGPHRMLDVGCGDGFITAGLVSVARQVVAVDLLHNSLVRTRIRANRAQFAQVGTDGTLPFVAQSFDVVVGLEVIEHCRDPRRFLDEMWRMLKPGGLLLLSTPNYKTFQRRLGFRAVRGLSRFPSFPIHWAGEGEDGTHFQEFEPAQLEQLLLDTGFAIDVLAGDFVGFALWRGRYTIQIGIDWLGRRFPHWAVDLMVKARKPEATSELQLSSHARG